MLLTLRIIIFFLKNIQIDLSSPTMLYHCSFSIHSLEYKSKPVDYVKYKEENRKRDEEEFVNPKKIVNIFHIHSYIFDLWVFASLLTK